MTLRSLILWKPLTSFFPIFDSPWNNGRIFSMAQCMVPFLFSRQANEKKQGIFFYIIVNPRKFSVWTKRPGFFFTNFRNSKLVGLFVGLLVNLFIRVFSIAPSSVSLFCCCFCPVLLVELLALFWFIILTWAAVIVLITSESWRTGILSQAF